MKILDPTQREIEILTAILGTIDNQKIVYLHSADGATSPREHRNRGWNNGVVAVEEAGVGKLREMGFEVNLVSEDDLIDEDAPEGSPVASDPAMNPDLTPAQRAALREWDDEQDRLRRAAPELLEACEAVLGQLDYLRGLWGDEGITRRLADQVRQAIAKAKGE